MKPFVLLILSVLLLPTLVLVKADDDEGDRVLASPKLRGAAAAAADGSLPEAEAAEEEGEEEPRRFLQDTTLCYAKGADGVARPASCASVGYCETYACCRSPASCFGLGKDRCDAQTTRGFAVEYVNDPSCPYVWSCCY